MTLQVDPAPVPLPEAAPFFDAAAVMAKAKSENFPVALSVLSPATKAHLGVIYRYARFVDDVGDAYAGDRLAALDWVESELERAFAGDAGHPLFSEVAATAAACATGRAPFLDLIAANRLDQVKFRYESFGELEEYCALSANSVGRLVLGVFGQLDGGAIELSDQICTALQLVEHLQDVGEDSRAGRVYLPAEDLGRFGVTEADLGSGSATPALRRLVAFECGRARELLRGGMGLVGRFSGAKRLAIAAFIGGGLSQLGAIETGRFDVLVGDAKASKTRMLRSTLQVLVAERYARRWDR